MPEAYTIKIFIPYGNPEGTKILSQFRWPGKCIAFPRNEWREILKEEEFEE